MLGEIHVEGSLYVDQSDFVTECTILLNEQKVKVVLFYHGLTYSAALTTLTNSAYYRPTLTIGPRGGDAA